MSETKTENLEKVIQSSLKAFHEFSQANVNERADLMRAIANEIENLDDKVIETAMEETNLSKGRLTGEKGRTVHQWRDYAKAVESGNVLDLRIDFPTSEEGGVKSDLRKTMVGLGPIAIFGASNFPFAFSTAGGDSASAIAAGNSVIVKVHPGHPKTSAIMTEAVQAAIKKEGYSENLFLEVSEEEEIGTQLVSHPVIKAVGFTGSFQGGKALFDLANKRNEPIPVYAEMGSINPLFLMPDKLKNHKPQLAKDYVGSMTLGTGQFCTNPGVLVAIKGEGLEKFIEEAKDALKEKEAGPMLHQGIVKNYQENATNMTTHKAVEVLESGKKGKDDSGQAILAKTKAQKFNSDKPLCEEVFGPFGLIVECENYKEMLEVASGLEGQLTVTMLAEEEELKNHRDLTAVLEKKCGRFIFNNFPTGVQVSLAMQHGGPFPSTTSSYFTSVGGDAVKRFMRPVAYQNWPKDQLPDELKDDNPLKLIRIINQESTTDSL